MRPSFVVLAGLMACAPPPPVSLGDTAGGGATGDPAVRIFMPSAAEIVPLDDDCVLRTLVVWDVDNIALVPFVDASGEAVPNAPGEGHVHVVWAPPAYEATHEQSFLMEQPGLLVGQSLTITVDLHENEHGELSQFPDYLSEVEIEVGADTAGACP